MTSIEKIDFGRQKVVLVDPFLSDPFYGRAMHKNMFKQIVCDGCGEVTWEAPPIKGLGRLFGFRSPRGVYPL